MDKRYQVFVSSTYADLKEERQQIIQALMEMDCIPAGMELFPAADEDQFAFIKKIIDDCDYYLLVIGGRYGSLTATGVSYTEQEYEYALSKGLRVVALLHENPDDIPLGKSETDPALRQRLQEFRGKVSKERLVRFWRSASELPGVVALSLSKTIKTYPARGWVRADRVASEDLLTELNDVRKQNEALTSELRSLKTVSRPKLEGLAGLDESTELSGTYYSSGRGGYTWSTKMTWQQIFFLIGPYLIQHPNAEKVKGIIEDDAFTKSGQSGTSARLHDQVFQTISVQLQALGLVKIAYSKTVGGGMGLFWSATPAGEKLTLELRTVKTSVTQKTAS
jgi:Domain of unknown function (DUF4062)